MARLAVVVSTYETPDALNAVLRAFAEQSDPDFRLVVADDGSSAATASVVDEWRPRFAERLTHAWQPDEGFRLARVLNLGALAVDADYLVFMHGNRCPAAISSGRSGRASGRDGSSRVAASTSRKP